jgi:hypothetical protein
MTYSSYFLSARSFCVSQRRCCSVLSSLTTGCAFDQSFQLAGLKPAVIDLPNLNMLDWRELSELFVAVESGRSGSINGVGGFLLIRSFMEPSRNRLGLLGVVVDGNGHSLLRCLFDEGVSSSSSALERFVALLSAILSMYLLTYNIKLPSSKTNTVNIPETQEKKKQKPFSLSTDAD